MSRTATPTVTRQQAEAVLQAIRTQFSAYVQAEGITEELLRPLSDDDLPQLVEDYDGAPFAIVWESNSPYEWAYRVFEGGVDEEMTELASEFGGGVVRTPAVTEPEGVHCEPLMSFILGIYPA